MMSKNIFFLLFLFLVSACSDMRWDKTMEDMCRNASNCNCHTDECNERQRPVR